MALQKSTYNATALWNALKRLAFQRSESRALTPMGPFFLDYQVSIDAADLDTNDEVLVAQMPSVQVKTELGIYLMGLWVNLTDVDTHATPTHAADFMAGSTVLISGSTIGQAGGSDDLDANLFLPGTDIQGLDIKMKSTTGAATAAAGTLKVRLLVILDRYREVGS